MKHWKFDIPTAIVTSVVYFGTVTIILKSFVRYIEKVNE